MAGPEERMMKDLLAAAKALFDANRLRALMALGEGELCVCQLIELLGLAPSTVSKHMAVLHQAGLVAARKDGRWIYYRLARRGCPPHVRAALAWVRGGLGGDPQVRRDAARLGRIRRMARETLCARYKR